jgi:predicted nucleic acid-binding protein
VQVLQEFYTQTTRERSQGRITHEVAIGYVRSFSLFPVQDMTLAIFQAAVATKQRFKISYWDAAIVEAARTLGCRTVLTEDLNHGQDYGGVRVVNPFLPA